MTAAALLERVEALRRSEPGRALAELDHEFAHATRGASAAARGALWRTRAHVLRSVRRTREAAAAYRRAAAWYARAHEPREEGRCAIGWLDALMYLGRTREARAVARRGRRLLAAAGDPAALARLLNNEGNLWHRLDLPERALACYREAVHALERAGDAQSARMIGTNIGNCLSLLGRCAEARQVYARARRAHAAAGAHNEALSAEYNLAYLDFLEHRDEAALAGLARVRAEATKRGYPSLAALARLDRAEILLRMGAHAEALAEADAAVPACEALGLRYEAAKAELFGALAQFRTGKPAAARRRIERALARFDAEQNLVWTGEALLALATVWWHDGNARAAAALLTAARRRFTAAHDHERRTCALALESRARLASGDARGARRCLALLPARDKRDSPRLEHLRVAAEAALAREAGDVPRARRLLVRAASAAERLASRILDEQWRATFWGEWGWPHRELAALELAQGRIAEAFEALEAGRGRALLGASRARAAQGGALSGTVRRWAAARHARERVHRAGEVVSEAPIATPEPTLRRALAAREGDVLRAAALQRALPAGARLIDYMASAGPRAAIGAITLTRHALAGRAALVSQAPIAQLVHALLFALRGAACGGARGADAPLEAMLAEAASLLLWPLLGGEAPAALAIAPVGMLTRLPWAALPLPSGQLLCESGPLVVVPGLRLALRVPAAPARGARPLVVAVAGDDLAGVTRETEAVLASFPDARVLAGREATAERFLALAGEAAWIHFAGHGGWSAESPQASGLQLADRWLLAGELSDTRLRARWVTLSACHTARALVRPGEEWFGLARSLLLAGAGAVVAAQWDVEDFATARLMSELYARLAGGLPMAHALAEAQAARHVAGAHPLEWAGFVTLGGPALLAPTRGTARAGHHVRGNRSGSPRVTTVLKHMFQDAATAISPAPPQVLAPVREKV